MAQIADAQYRAEVDPRELAIYTPADAALFLGIKRSTLPTLGFMVVITIPSQREGYSSSRLSAPPTREHKLLSFFNLAEAHVLAATRYKHNVSVEAIRTCDADANAEISV